MHKVLKLFIFILISVLFFLIHKSNNLLFHCLIEIISIIIAFNIFVIGWYSRHMSKNSLLILLAIAFLAVGIMDNFHMFTFTDMGIFKNIDNNIPIQFWLSARYIQSISLLIGVILLIKNIKLNTLPILSFYITLIFFLILIIFKSNLFPNCFIVGKGLTLFKIISEYIICMITIISQILIWKNKSKFKMSKTVIISLLLSLEFTIFSEIFFTFYKNLSDANYWGHLFKLFSFYFIFNALVVELLKKPYENLFKEYSNSQKKLVATGSMFSTMFHDIKTPLTNIRALGQLGSKTTDSIKDKDYFLKIINYVDNVTKMLNKNLHIFDSTELHEINPVKPMQEVARELKPLCRSNNIELVLDINNIKSKILIEADLFKRVIYNLVNNSVNSIKGEGKIEIKFKEQNNFLIISVKDNGPGIPSELRNDIFKPFNTGNKGTGLGLYMVEFTVSNMFNGKVWFKTQKNEGTTFYIKIPLVNEYQSQYELKKNLTDNL